MLRNALILITCLISSFTGLAQDGIYDFGGKSAALGNASVTISDAYSVFNNIGALATVEKTTAFAGYRNLFGINELNTLAAGFIKPFKVGVLGVSFYRFGGDLLNQQKASIGFSNKFGLVSLGANISYVQNSIDFLGKSSSIAIEFGGVATITKQLKFGAYVFNLNQARLSSGSEQNLPTSLKAGISYLPIEELAINAEIVKRVDAEERIKLGISYDLLKNFEVRTGIQTNPVTGSFGFGFTPSRFLIDYAYGNHSVLGDIHDITFGITL